MSKVRLARTLGRLAVALAMIGALLTWVAFSFLGLPYENAFLGMLLCVCVLLVGISALVGWEG